MPTDSVRELRPTARLLGLLCSTALIGSVAAPSISAHAAQLYGATGGQGDGNGGAGGDAGLPGSDGTGPDAGSGGSAGTAAIPNGGDGLFVPGGPGGGGGGYSHEVSGDLSTDYSGGNGGNGGYTSGIGNGGGGAGGDGVRNMEAAPDIDVTADLTGGNGGTGDSSSSYPLGGGGGGGAGLVLVNNGIVEIQNPATVGGGNGGNGGGGGLSFGGGGGAGVILNAGGALTNRGVITGGTGGASAVGGAGIVLGDTGTVTNDGSITGGKGGFSNAGGAAIEFRNGGSVLNTGTIIGGEGNSGSGNLLGAAGGIGSGGASGFVSGVPTRGNGGAGIIGADLSVMNGGTIAGGISSYHGQANAITFTGGNNTLFLRNGSTITGNVVVESGATGALVLGDYDDPPTAFDVSKIVDTATGGSNEFVGFSSFQKLGPNTLRLTGTGAQDWAINEGTLIGDTDSLGGDLTFATGTGTRGVVFDQGYDSLYAGTISGSGGFTKMGAGTLRLTGNLSAFSADRIEVQGGMLEIVTGLLTGTAVIDSSGPGLNATARAAGSATWTLTNAITVGFNSDGRLTVENGGKVVSGGAAIGAGANSNGAVTVTGENSVWESSVLTYIGFEGVGSLVIEDGGSVVTTGIAGIGASSDSTGTVRVSGDGSAWTTAMLGIGGQGDGTLTVANGGRISVTGATFGLAFDVASFGTLNIGAASGETAQAAGAVDAASLTFGPGTGTLVFNHTGNLDGSELAFSSSLSGLGTILQENGTTSLTGDNSGFTGTTTVSGGTLLVNDTLGSAAATLAVGAGGTLGGSGIIGGNATVDGTLSAGNSPGTLTVDGNLTLNGGSTSLFELNTPGIVGGTGAGGNDFVKVGGNLSLGGTLDARVASAGYYRLFEYDGTLSGAFAGGTVTGTGGFMPVAPNDPDLRYDVPGQVNLSVLGTGQTMQFWDGGDTTGNGTLDGGAGTWTGFGTNWTDSSASVNGGWGGSVGVFAGAAGAVTVDGTQHFDTLQFKTDDYTLTGGTLALSPASGTAGTFNIDNGVSTTVGSIIADGAGNGLKKTGGGTLVLTGANTYSGGTQLLGGTLSVSSDANLGTAGGLTFDEGTLQNTAAFATARDITLDAGGGTFRTDANLTLAGMVSGAGALTKDGGGTLTLSGTNTYEGGTTIRYGDVIATSDGALGSGAVVIDGRSGYTRLRFEGASAGDLALTVKDGWLGFDNGANAGNATIHNKTSYDSVVFFGNATAGSANIFNESGGVAFYGTADAGNATVVNRAQGYTFFTGSSTADHATIASDAGGRVDISSLAASGISIGSLSGDGTVSLGAKALTLGGLGKNDTIGGAIEDGGFAGGVGGSLIKIGAGTLTLNGVNTYTGLTTVADGKLIVGDDGHADAALAGAVNVNAGGTLGGIGTVGTTTIASGGTVAPGNSVGTLRVDGDITFAAGSAYVAEIAPSLDGDLIDASGKATIDGGTVHAAKAGGVYTPGSRWTIVGADGGVTGTFDALAQDMPFVDLALGYDANHVYIDAIRNAVAFCDVAATFNQCSTGNGLETTGVGNPVYDAVAALPDEDSAGRALDGLSGEIHASARSALIEDSAHVRDAATARIRAAFEGVGTVSLPVMAYGPDGAEIAPAATDRLAAWGQAFGSWGSFDSDGDAAKLDHDTGGLLLGMDGFVTENWRLGLIAGYSHSSFDAGERASSGSSDNYHLGLYAGTRWGNLGFRSGLAYSWHDVETNRAVSFPGFADGLSADYNAGTFQAFGELGYRIDTAAAAFEPFADLAYVSLSTEGFTEKGGAAALTSHSQTTDVTFTTLGIRAATGFDLGGMRATARGMLGWRHAFGDTTPLATLAFAGADDFTVAGTPIAENAAVIEAGLDLGLTDTASFGVAYQGQIASDARQHGFNAKLNLKF